MKLLYVTPYYAPAYPFGGVVRAVEGMAQALTARGHEVTVLTTDACSRHARVDAPDRELLDGVQVVRIRNTAHWLRARANLSTPRGMGQVARELLAGMDAVHLHEFRTVEALLTVPEAAKQGVPMVMSPHGTLTLETGRSRLKAGWDRWVSPRIAGGIAGVVALTDAEAEDVAHLWERLGIEPPPVQVVPNGVNLREIAPSAAARAEFRHRYGLGTATVCLFLGRLHARKGVDVLAEAFRAANAPDAKLVIAGPDEGMRAALEALHDPRIVLTGYLDAQERLAALAAADVFALPATGEGLSMAALEAMAAGLPVILSPGCYLPDIEPAGAGFEVLPAVEPLAEALGRLLANTELRLKMGEAARALVEARFTWPRVAEQMEHVYAGLLPVGSAQSQRR
ncbi:MAG TPA: glycosyltransferase [Candidatus Limnocylindrales bacterium]|nr:glycosyltransferase [Candidatus Limnocylindrales bacterium]